MMNNFKNMGLSDGGKAPASPSPFPLARQQSIYSLTFDEIQNTLGGAGKDFGSMNMDEFLRNIWTAEETHAMASALGSTADSNAAGGLAGTLGLQRQGSLTLPRTMSQKTVDEVWKDLIKESSSGQGPGQGPGGAELPQQHRQPTLGEMTLEEFLVRAGVVREDNTNPQQVQQVQRPMVGSSITTATNSNMNGGNSIFFGDLPGSNNNNRGLGLGFAQNGARNNALGVAATRPYPPPLQVRGNVDVVGIGDPGMNNGLMSIGGGVTVATSVGSPDGLGKGNGDLSSLSPVPYHVFGSGMRGRKCSGAVEKVVERRQRRMIKNRESAARSRARKQAYTMELEAEVAKLKEQNQELEKKQAEMMEMQKNQVMEIINQPRAPKKLCLRRTQTGPW